MACIVVQAKRNPAEAGFAGDLGRSVSACANHFDLNATVLRATFFGLVVSHRLLLAFAFGVDAVLFDAL
jgi:hypothetical protein